MLRQDSVRPRCSASGHRRSRQPGVAVSSRSLDNGDGGRVRFMRYAVAARRRVTPRASATVLEILQPLTVPRVPTLLGPLIHELSRVPPDEPGC